jgi:hypothetical protein
MSETLRLSLGDRYELRGALGAGGMGAVWRARDLRLDRDVAVKTISGAPGPLAQPELAARMQREAEILAGLEHPNLLRVLDLGEANGVPYLVTELLDGPTFDQIPVEDDPLEWMLQIAEALDVVHDAGVVHRDVKPVNIVLASGDRPVLIDFGLVSSPAGPGLTRTGQVLGTASFLAPEWLGGGEVGPAADWWSWGATLFMLGERRPPVGAQELIAHAQEPASVPVKWPERLRWPLHRAVLEAVLVGDPEARAGGAAHLRKLARGRPAPVEAPPDESGAHAPSAKQGLGRMPMALGAALAVGALVATWVSPPEPVKEPAPGPGLLDRWGERVAGLDAARRTTRLHDEVYRGPQEGYLDAMLGARLGRAEAPARLDAAVSGLPWVGEFRGDAAAMTAVLRDPARPLRDRASLAGAVGEFAVLDAYFEAWGRPGPYGAGAVLQAWARFADLGRVALETPKAGPGPWRWGRRRLLSWSRTLLGGTKVVVANAADPSDWERSAWTVARLRSGGFDPYQHEVFTARFELAAAPARRAELYLRLANLQPPNRALLRVNDHVVVLGGDASRTVETEWVDPTPRMTLVRLDLPRGILRIGDNHLSMRASPLPGLPNVHGFVFDWVDLDLGEP